MNIAKYGKGLATAAVLGSAALLGACVMAPPPASPSPPSYAVAAAPTYGACKSCGTITSISTVNPGDYRVALHMDDGTQRAIDLTTQPAFQVGDRVQILVRTP